MLTCYVVPFVDSLATLVRQLTSTTPQVRADAAQIQCLLKNTTRAFPP